MPISFRALLVAALLYQPIAAFADGANFQSFPIPGQGDLQLAVPNSWRTTFHGQSDQSPATVILHSETGAQFQVLITAIWQGHPASGLLDDMAIRDRVALAARTAAPESVEGVLPLQRLIGARNRGYSFAATDRAPKPGEYKYMTQGIISLQTIILTFTILTNDDQNSVVISALDMLRGAVHVPAGSV
jgi:hypothetical protein